MRLKPVEKQTIVITGGSSGIGLATAQAAAKRGARVVLASRDETDLERAVERIRRDGGEAVHAVADVADFEALHGVAETALRQFGGFDTWVNNAGVSIYGKLEDVPVADGRRLFETNYWGVVNGSLIALPHLKRRGGALINIGSVLSETAAPVQGHYSASKHAVKAFTDALRIELEAEGAPVSITLIQPAAIDTPYPEHARTYLGAEPTHMPPVYAPEVVVKALLTCAESPRRNVRVGGGAKMFTVMEKTAPGLADRYKRSMIEGSKTDELPKDDDTHFAPRPGDGRVRGHFAGRVKKTSAYTSAALHPMATLGVVAALGVGIAVVLNARRD